MSICAFSACTKDVPQLVKGLCPACYQRQWKKGSLYYKVDTETLICEVADCGLIVKAGGLCQKHYMRVRRHGSTVVTRPNGYGGKSKHPLWERYKSMLRVARRNGGYDLRWDDFWAFVDDVGDAPSGQRLYRKNTKIRYEKDNMEWRAPILAGQRLSDHAAYQRAYRTKRGSANRDRYLRNTYKLSLEEFNALLAAQGGGCAICSATEGHLHPITSEPVALAMDHSKETGQNRGILCHPHNRALGLFNHDIALLREAIAYLTHHASKEA